MDPTLIPSLIEQYGLPLVAIALLSFALVWLFRLLLKEMRARIERAESLVDKLTPSLDRLSEAQETSNQITQALLDEVRRDRK